MKKSAWLRLALILVCAAMMLSLFACGGGEAVETEGSSKKPETEATEKQTESETTEGTEETEPQVDTTETETKEATTEKKVDTTETEKKPVETTETEKKPVETTEKPEPPVVEADPLKIYIGPDKLATASVNANRLDAGVVSADGSYVTYKNKADGGDGYVQVYGGGAVVSGQYLVIKYRYPTSNQTTATNIEIFSSTVNGGPTGGDNTRMPVKADGEWHLAVVDMAACKGEEKFPAGADGKYTVKYARFDVLDGNHVAGDSIDVAYAGITDDPAEVIALAKKEGVKTIDYTAASNKSETYYSSTGTTTPTPADVANVFIGPEQLASASVNTGRVSGKEVSKDGSYATFTANGTGGDGYALVLSGGAEVSGQYLIIKYRYPTTSNQTYLEIFASCTNAGPTGGDNIRFNVKTDGEWHVQVVDFADFNSKFTANEDGTYTVKYARVDLLDSNSTAEGETVDIAYVAFADDYQNVLKANGDSKTVDYRLGAEEIYSLYTSTGTELPAMTDVANKYFDAEDLAGKAPTGTNIGKVELSEDKSYVSIYGKGAGDGFFTVFSGNTDVTGQYVIMKYRYPATNAEGYAPNARPLFAGNVMNGPTGGDTTGSFPVVADGEWHMTVFNIAAHITEEWFAPAEDGTYALKYLRFDIADGMPEDCCIDIQYIALTDDVNNLLPVAKGEGLYTVEARLTADGTVVYYPDTNSTEPPAEETETGTEGEGEVTETETQTEGEIIEIDPDEDQGDVDYEVPYFRFSIDYINGVRDGASGTKNVAKTFKPYSTTTDGYLILQGWFFGISGVAGYEYSLDGGATWYPINDTAGNYTYGSDPNGIDKIVINNYTQLLGTPGFGENAVFNSGSTALKIDLGDLYDKKVTVAVSAILNSGDRVEFLRVLDVFAQCTHEANTNEWSGVEGDLQKETTSCSACNKAIVRCVTSVDGLLHFGADFITSKAGTLTEDASGMDFARITSNGGSDQYTFLYSDDVAATDVSNVIAVLYRTDKANYIELFLHSEKTFAEAGGNSSRTCIADGKWHLMVFNFSGNSKYNGESLKSFRLDYINSGATVKGEVIDIAFAGFFNGEAAAYEYYKGYLDNYIGVENCDHGKVAVEYDEENEIYASVCDICDKSLEEIGPFNYMWDATDLYDKSMTAKPTVTLSEDKSYVTITGNDSSKEVYYNNLFENETIRTSGKYLIVKFATNISHADYNKGIQIYTNTTGAGAKEPSAGYINHMGDNGWHIAVVDLSRCSQFIANDEGDYVGKFLRLDVFDPGKSTPAALPSDQYMQIGFVAMCDDLQAARNYLAANETEKNYCGHSITHITTNCEKVCDVCGETLATGLHTYTETYTEANGVRTYVGGCDNCTIEYTFDVPANVPGLFATGKELYDAWSAQNYNVQMNADGSVTVFHTAGAAETVVNLFAGNTTYEGRYLAIKYSSNNKGSNEIYAGTTKTYASSGSDGMTVAMVNTGNKAISAFDLATIANFTPNGTNGEYIPNFVRIDTHNPGHTSGSGFTIYYAAVFADAADLHSFANGTGGTKEDPTICSHNKTYITSECEKLCLGCGKFYADNQHAYAEVAVANGDGTVTYDLKCTNCGVAKYSDKDYSITVDADNAPNLMFNATSLYDRSYNKSDYGNTVQGFGKYELIVENSIPFVRFYGNDNGTEPYAQFFIKGSKPSGQYLVFKIRVPEGQTSPNAISIFTSTTLSSMTGGGKDNKDISLSGNSGWMTYVVDLTKVGTTFTTDENGNYIMRYLRMDFLHNGATSSQYVDVAFVAVTDNFAEAIKLDKTNTGDYVEVYMDSNLKVNKVNGRLFINYATVKNQFGAIASDGATASGMPYATLTANKTGEIYAGLFESSNGTELAKQGNYLGILYQAPKKVAVEGVEVDNKVGGVQLFINPNAAGVDAGINTERVNYVVDGNWHVLLVNISNVKSGKYTPDMGLKYLRADIMDGGHIVGGQLNVANISFFANIEEAEAYFEYFYEKYNLACGHDYAQWMYISDSDDATYVSRQTGVCTICGKDDLGTRNTPHMTNIENVAGAITYHKGSEHGIAGQKVNAIVEWGPDKSTYPTEGATTSAGGSFTVQGWGGVSGDGFSTAFRVIDAATGDILQGWTACGGGMGSTEQAVRNLVAQNAGADCVGYRFSAVATLTDAALNGKVVNIEYAYVPYAAEGQSDNLVPFARVLQITVVNEG